jgi:hypothetical protein
MNGSDPVSLISQGGIPMLRFIIEFCATVGFISVLPEVWRTLVQIFKKVTLTLVDFLRMILKVDKSKKEVNYDNRESVKEPIIDIQ